ncbi:MAG: putative Ig domain-containing protein, partial [Candidatus Saccharimonadales bacterium]
MAKIFLVGSMALIVLVAGVLWQFAPVWAAQPMTVNSIPDQNATEEAAFDFQFAANTFEDTDCDTLTYSTQLAGGDALPTWLSFDALTRTFSGTPANSDVGTVSIDVIADDGNGGTVTDTFNIAIANTNDAPTIANAIPNQNATEDSTFNFQFSANTFNDVDAGTILTYSAQLAGGGALPIWLSFDAATRTFSGTPLNAHVGTVSIDVIASDGNGGTVTDTFNIVVANTNDAPTIESAIPSQAATESAAFNFQFAASTFSDIDAGDTLSYTAQLAGGGALPAWLSFDAVTRTFSGTPASGDVGTVSIDVIADDGNGGTVTDTFNIDITAAPNVGPTDISLTTNSIQQSATITGATVGVLSSSDADSSDFTYTLVGAASAAPGSCAFSTDNASFQIDGSSLETAGTLVTGTYSICVQTSDDYASYKKGFTIFVEDDAAPTASIVVSDTNLVAGETATVTITFSEVVTGVLSGDFTVGSGSLGGLSSPDGGITWVGTLTPSLGVVAAINTIVLDNTTVTDLNDNSGIGTTSSNNYAVDTVAPAISTILAISSDDGESATITWTTDKAASSQIAVGLTSESVNGIYAEQDTSPRVTSHNYQVSDVSPCTRYYYQVLSKDPL